MARFLSENRTEASQTSSQVPDRLIHSPRETQCLLGISHAQVYRLLAAGRLKGVKIGSRRGITRESIEAVAAGEA
jgi:excisionase family DNA binding protein